MKNFKNILVLLLVTFLFSGCNTIKKGFTPDKRTGEEFLVEKKSPLVMPPDYSKLPIPGQKKTVKEDEKSNVKSMILGSKEKLDPTANNSESMSTIEKIILKKIKRN